MEQDRIKALLEEASEHYNQGRFEEAIAGWRQVLGGDPENQKAREGIRMASLLVADWDDGSVQSSSSGSSTSRSAPRAAAAAEEASPDLELALQVGREALAAGRHDEAAEAARRALELDPGNMEACGILSLSADDETAAAPVRIEPVAGEMPGEPTGESLDEITNPHLVVGSTGPIPAAAPPQADLSPEDLRRISVILDDGQREFDAGRFQESISVWSRVFVIDRANTEAGLRIDRAKETLERRTRDVDEMYYKAVDAYEAGRVDDATDQFTRVLELAPTHPEARAYLDEIKSRASGGTPPQQEFGIDPPRPARPSHDEETAAMFSNESVPLAPPEPDMSKPALLRERGSMGRSATQEFIDRPLGAKKGAGQGGGARKMLVGVSLAIVFAAAGVSAWLWFGNGNGNGEMSEAEATPAETPRPPRPRPAIPGPSGTPKGGTIEVVPGAASKPLETPAEPNAPTAAQPPAPAANPAEAAALFSEGQTHYQQGRWAEAALALKKSLEMNPTDFQTKDLLDKAMVELEKQAHFEQEMQQAGTYFSEQDYASALHKFYRLQQERPDMRVIEACIRNSWYNWGVALMQSGSFDDAAEKFNEVLQLRPRDREAESAHDIAQRYHKRQRDASYEAFVRTLTLRPLDEQ